MTDKFTKGPWMCPSEGASLYGFPRWDIGFKDGDCFGVVAKALPVKNENGVGSKETRQANAQLIATAPDLLEALEGVIALGNINSANAGDVDKAFTVAREAIARARGES